MYKSQAALNKKVIKFSGHILRQLNKNKNY